MEFIRKRFEAFASLNFNKILNNNLICNGLILLGLYIIFKWVLGHICKIFGVIKLYYIHPIFGRKIRWPIDVGEWAVVTGATDGIGKEFALQLARQGMNIVLISRSLERLKKVSHQIQTESKVKVLTIEIDFTSNVSIYKEIEDKIKGLEIGLLINNVAVFIPYPLTLDELDPATLWGHVSVNVGATTMMTRLILPQLKQRKKGGIINVSSSAALAPFPLMASYSASKMYMNHLTEGLREECKDFNVTFLTLTPFYVATKMIGFNDRIGKPSFFIPTPDKYVKSALNCFGAVEATTGYFRHSLEVGVIQNTPFGIFGWVFRKFMKLLAKEAKEKGL